MVRARTVGILVGATAAAAAAGVVLRHGRGAMGRRAPGGILIRDVAAYDALSHRLLLGSLFDRIAADIARVAPVGARVLEVGCGPGRLSIRLARRYGLDVTGLDLDPAMIGRARTNAGGEAGPSFLVGDVASMAFPDGSFDVVVSTLSMHHWADPTAGLTEIGRVLGRSGRALVWDFRSRVVPLHKHMPDPVDHMRGSGLRVGSSRPWPWPLRFRLIHRLELVHA